MSQTDKAAAYAELKEAGYEFSKHYREYSTDELDLMVDALHEFQGGEAAPVEQGQTIPQSSEPVHTSAGMNTYRPEGEEQPVRIDENGLIWYREEVKKPAVPQPRARRVLKYVDPGTKIEEIRVGNYTESFEVAGTGRNAGEVKITMPSYQVGVYKDPRLPFKIHVYNGMTGFDLFDVQKFYNGADMVPESILRTYIANDLCYDIRTTIRAIQNEHRQNVLKEAQL